MERLRLNRPYLESLSTGELTHIALEEGIDVPGGLERVFIIEELLELGEENERDLAEETPLADFVIAEPAPLPRQYNITYLDVLIRDPLWVFAFWEIKAAARNFWENAEDFGGYCLKVHSIDSAGKLITNSDVTTNSGVSGNATNSRNAAMHGGDASFVVNVGVNDTSWYLGFSSIERPAGVSWFQVELCCLLGDAEETVAQARPFRLPALLPSQGDWSGQSRLRILSGLDDIPVIRSADRFSRSPTHPDKARP
jgi:hypothetical protein